ncbi:MAG: Ger(x)C family spore germination protein, partial [Tissierellia bacterium]|nr:Ger(x)C family spore germination protein [Tissierellia bacterium]
IKCNLREVMMAKKIILILLTTIILTGCWDSAEINDRDYIFAVGIDKGEDENLVFTAEIPKINEGSEEQRIIFTQESKNLSNFYNDSFVRSEKVISDRLMQVIVIGESIAEDTETFKRLFDEIQRSPQINRRVKIAVAKGDAKKIIETEIPSNPIVGRYLSEMLIKLKKSNVQSIYTFDEALLNLQGFGSGLIPIVEKFEDSLKIENAAVMKDYKKIGNLNSLENEIVMLILDPKSSNIRNINLNVEDSIISLSTVNIKSTNKIKLSDDKLSVNYYVTLYCFIESFTLNNKSLADKKFIDKIKEAAVNQISEQTDSTINKVQKIYKIDLFKIKNELYKYHNIKYKKIEDNYQQVFENADINVYYAVDIKSTGLVK